MTDKTDKTEKFVYFSDMADIVSAEVAGHIEAAGYTPFSGDIGAVDGDNLAGAILANPPVGGMRGTIEGTGDGLWAEARDMFAAPMLEITQAAGEILSRNKRGSIIYLNSIHAEKPVGGGFLYTMGCAAVQALCREAALIYGSFGVGCYNIMRGIVAGEAGYFASNYSPIHHNSELRFPQERLPPADSLNELCAFLLGGGAYILNGADLHADEGFALYYGKSNYYNA